MGKRTARLAMRAKKDEPQDLGIPGKLYFDKPNVIDISTKRKGGLPLVDPITNNDNLGPEEFYTTVGKCRLKSSFNYPTTPPPKDIQYALTMRPLQNDAHEYVAYFRRKGYHTGAIVTRRYQPGYRHRWHSNWGIIQRVNGNVPWYSQEAWFPYVVKWFNVENNISEEPAWGEDLILIHQALDEDLLEQILEEQGAPPRTGYGS